ncbi:hypothetical protein Scep_027501 [Stephania cephalantha]|uniref:Uncharacterized protein n=1 Tax=Stephania cephalantha TaxID=152367 RepID=A0AAP0EGH6_9MAGN
MAFKIHRVVAISTKSRIRPVDNAPPRRLPASPPLPRRCRCLAGCRHRPLVGAAAGATADQPFAPEPPLPAFKLSHRVASRRRARAPSLPIRPFPAPSLPRRRSCSPSSPSRRPPRRAAAQFLAAVSAVQPPPAAALLLLRAITADLAGADVPQLPFSSPLPRREPPSPSLRVGALRHRSLYIYMRKNNEGLSENDEDDDQCLAQFINLSVSVYWIDEKEFVYWIDEKEFVRNMSE